MSKNIPATNAKEEVLKKFNNKPKEIDNRPEQQLSEFENKWNMNNKIIELFANNIEKDQELRQGYAKILIGILVIELIALIVIFILAGCKVLNYSENVFNIFISGGIAEIFILVRVIVKYLFKDNLTEALKIIIENNNKPKYKIKNHKNNKSDKPREI